MLNTKKPTPIEKHILFDWIALAKNGYISSEECELYLAKDLWSKEIFNKVRPHVSA